MNITLEKIQERLKAEREKLTLGKQVSDKWIEKRAARLIKSVTEDMEESELDNIVTDSIEDMEDVQSNINKVMAEEAAKQKLPSKATEPLANPEPHKDTELPDDVKEMLAFYKQQKEATAITSKREAICNAVKGLSDAQKNSFKEYVNEMTPPVDGNVDELAAQYMSKFTKIWAITIGDDTGTAGASGMGTKAADKEFIESLGKVQLPSPI